MLFKYSNLNFISYFIAERKAAVPIDAAVDKIIHSCNSLTTPGKLKEIFKFIFCKMFLLNKSKINL